MRTGRAATLAITIALVTAAAGCTGSSQPTATLPAPSTSSPGSLSPATGGSRTLTETARTTSVEDTQRQVLDAYLGMQQAFEKAEAIPDPGYPDLPRYASGAALKLLTAGLTSMKTEGLRGSGATSFQPRVTELAPPDAPTRARVQDCMDTSRTRLEKISGSPYKDTPGGWRLVIATVEQVGGSWKVTGLGVHDVGSCAG